MPAPAVVKETMEAEIVPIQADAPDSGYGGEHRGRSLLRDWRLKAAVQTVLSAAPVGARLNYLLQRHVTRTLPISDTELRAQVAKAQRNLAALQQHGSVGVGDAHLYEFGAGWDLLMPLAHYAMGARRQTVIDIRPLARADLVRGTARRLNAQAGQLGLRRPIELPEGAQVAELVRALGIDYRAPADARDVHLPPGSVDLASSNDVLEHVPIGDVRAILLECRRVLRPHGVLHCRVDYQDHYWYFDGRVSPWNFLRFGARTWRRFNPDLHYQSRIRHCQLLDVAASCGLAVVEDRHPVPTNQELLELSHMTIASEFRGVPLDELAIRYATVTFRPAPEPALDAHGAVTGGHQRSGPVPAERTSGSAEAGTG